ncbi:MAG: hypothetical protein FD123_3452 [Bacteroidetes bacterium]|nr:MAG: hypothetical protein FD123_3452 [Bacteroidota bacterium]
MWRCNLITLFFLFAFLRHFAQGGAPVILVPHWDEIFPQVKPEVPEAPLPADSIAKKKIKYIGLYSHPELKSGRKRKGFADTLRSWRFDAEGRPVNFYNAHDGRREKFTYGHGDKVKQYTAEYYYKGASHDTVSYAYNRAGLVHRIMRHYKETYGSNQFEIRDTAELFYDNKERLIAYNVKGNGEDAGYYSTFEYDAGGRLIKKSKNKNGKGVVAADSIHWEKSAGRYTATHFYRNLEGEPFSYALIDRVEIDSASGLVMKYAYVFGPGNGNRIRTVNAGRYAEYEYENGLEKSHITRDNANRISEFRTRKYRYGIVAEDFYADIDWRKSVKGTLRYDCRKMETVYDTRNFPLSYSDRKYTSASPDPASPTLVEDKKQMKIYRCVIR